MYHHLRGLLLRARGDLAGAEAELKSAIYSTTGGFTRTNLELSRILIELGRPSEAVPLLQAALRGPLDGSTLYVSQTELHNALADAWVRLGMRDSAAYHYRRVLTAWRNPDRAFLPQRAQAERRLALLMQPTDFTRGKHTGQ